MASPPSGQARMAKKVKGSQVPLSGWLEISQSRSSPRAPTDTLPVPMPPSGKAATVASGPRTRAPMQALWQISTSTTSIG